MSQTPDGTSYTIYNSHDQAAQTLVFIHGVGLNQHVWQPQIDHFVARYNIVVYDMLGHGSSPRPPENVTLAHYVGQLHNLLTFLQKKSLQGKKVTLIGHSMGALVAVAYSLAHPLVVNKLVPMNIVYGRDPDQRAAVVARADHVLETGQVAGIDAAIGRWFTGYDDAASRKKIDAVRDWLTNVDPIGYGRTYKLFATSDDAFTDQLHNLPMPVLYLTGATDPNSTPAMSHQMAAQTPNARAAVIPNEAHMMAYICPKKVNAILDDFCSSEAPS